MNQAGVILDHVRKLARADGHVPDRELLERFSRHRDEAAFGTLVQRHRGMVMQVCRRVLHHWHDAEEGCQAAFVVLASKAGSRYWHESVGNWLYQVAYRLALRARATAVRRHKHENRST